MEKSEQLEKYEINELEAWKLMMDSMVKFIEASTKVMNTFTEKANSHLKLPIISSCEIQSMLGPALSALDYRRNEFTKSSRPGSAPERENLKKVGDSDYEQEGRSANNSKSSRPLKERVGNEIEPANTKNEEIPEGNDGDNTNKCSIIFDNISPTVEDETKLISEDETLSAPEHLETTKEDIQLKNLCCPVGELQKQTQYDKKEDQKMSTESMIHLMAVKLEEAQNEIDYLKNELMKIQSSKNINMSAALYRDYDKAPKSQNSTRVENTYDNTQNMSSRNPTVPARSLISPTESCRQSSAKFHQSTVTQRRSVPLRMRPKITTNEMVYLRSNNMQQRRRVQSSTGYEQLPIEMYDPRYQPYQRQMYPIYTRPSSPETEHFFNTQNSTIDPGYNYQTGQSVYDTCEGTAPFRHRKSENYLSMSDEASGEEYLCDNELF